MKAWLRNVALAVSRLLAAILGWTGTYTLCAECGASRCRLCWYVRGICGIEHCVNAALDEGRLLT